MHIILDYDGTLHNTIGIYKPAFKNAKNYLEKIGHPLRDFTDKEMSDNLGRTPKEMWDITAPNLSNDLKREVGVMIEKDMNQMIQNGQAKLYDHIPEVLQTLSKKHTLIFLSNCTTSYMENHRKIFHLDDYFSGYYWAQKYPDTPKYEIFSKYILADYGNQDYLMIGDRIHDIQVGVKNNIPTIGCLYGFPKENELSQATYFAKEPLDILRIVKDINC